MGDAQAETLREQQVGKQSPILKGDRLTPCLLGGEVSACGKSGSSPRRRQPLGPSGTLHRMKERIKNSQFATKTRKTSALHRHCRPRVGHPCRGAARVPHTSQGMFPKDLGACRVQADGAALCLDGGFLLTATRHPSSPSSGYPPASLASVSRGSAVP